MATGYAQQFMMICIHELGFFQQMAAAAKLAAPEKEIPPINILAPSTGGIWGPPTPAANNVSWWQTPQGGKHLFPVLMLYMYTNNKRTFTSINKSLSFLIQHPTGILLPRR